MGDMRKLLYISVILCALAPISANALNPYRQKDRKPSIEINLIALRYLKEDVSTTTYAPIASKPVIAPPEARRSPRLQSEQKNKISSTKPKKAPAKPKPVTAPVVEKKIEKKVEAPKEVTRPKPAPAPKAPEPKLDVPKFTPPPEPAPVLEIPPLPSFIKEDTGIEPAHIPEPKTVETPKVEKKIEAPKAPEPKLEIPKFEPIKDAEPEPVIPEKRTNLITPAPVAETNQVEIPDFEVPKFEPPKIATPEIEAPKFEAPAIPESPAIPEISANEETITVPELPSLEREIAATTEERTVVLPPPIFENDNSQKTAQATNPDKLPSMAELFGETPKPPVPNVATDNEPKSTIGKPALETVKLAPQELPSLNTLPISSEDPAISVPFTETEVDFPLSEQAGLLEIIAAMRSNPNSVIKVVSYASGTPDQTSQAKRTALARALSVRKILKEREIESERIIIRPMGNKSTTGVPDRVDIFLTNKEGV